MLGAFAAVSLAVVLVVSCGILLDSSLRAPIPVERLRAAAVVVQASPRSADAAKSASALPERPRPWRPGDPRRRCRASRQRSPTARSIQRDRRRTADCRPGPSGLPPVGHGWESAALTPFALTSGHPPRTGAEIVLDGDSRERADRSSSATGCRS